MGQQRRGSTNWANPANNSAVAYVDGGVVTFGDTNLVSGGSVSNSASHWRPTLRQPRSPSAIARSTIASPGSGGITGTTGIVLNGTGNVVLGTSNSFTSPVQINAGSLTITNAAALGNATQATVASGGALQIQGGIFANPVPLLLNGAGLAASPAGALVGNGGVNTYPGAVTLAGPATIAATSGTLTLTGGIANNGNLLTVGGAGSVVVSTLPITGGGGLTVAGPAM